MKLRGISAVAMTVMLVASMGAKGGCESGSERNRNTRDHRAAKCDIQIIVTGSRKTHINLNWQVTGETGGIKRVNDVVIPYHTKHYNCKPNTLVTANATIISGGNKEIRCRIDHNGKKIYQATAEGRGAIAYCHADFQHGVRV